MSLRERQWTPPNTANEAELHDWALKMWRRMDRDNSGSLTRRELDCEEFFHIVKSILLPNGTLGMARSTYARSHMDLNQAIDFLLRKADVNNDRKINFEEFKVFMLALRKPQLAVHTANLIFSLFDSNRDQVVDEYEFRQIYRFYLGHNPTEVEFQDEWARLDSQNKGFVDRREYTRWLQTSANPIFRQHSPSPTSAYISGEIDFHASKNEFLRTTPGAKRMTPLAFPKEEVLPWRPWHSYSHMCWAKVSQARPNVQKGADQLQTSQSAIQLSPPPSSHMAEPRSSSQGSSMGKKKRSYVMHAVPSSRGSNSFRTTRSTDDRIPWTQRINDPKWTEKPSVPQRNSCTINVASKSAPVIAQVSENVAGGNGSSTSSQGVVVTGSLNVSADNLDTLFADDAALNVLAEGIAGAAGLHASSVEVTPPKLLRDRKNPGGPQPGGTTVRLDYAVYIPSDFPKAEQEAVVADIFSLTTAQLNTTVKQKFKRLELKDTPELLPVRKKFNYGRMKHPTTGKRQHWVDNWTEMPQIKDRYVSGTLSFCCPGPPPRHLYADEYYDEP